jgi:hypothetical protein
VKVGKAMLRETVTASVALAAFAIAGGLLTGQASIAVGVAIGLVIGAFNGHLLMALIQRDVPFVGGSLVRMALLSGIGIMTAVIVGAAPWAVLLGIAGAQAVLAAAAVRQGLRA